MTIISYIESKQPKGFNMITLESKMKVADEAMMNAQVVMTGLKAFAEFRGETLEELKNSMANDPSIFNEFKHYHIASVVSMVSDKAKQYEM